MGPVLLVMGKRAAGVRSVGDCKRERAAFGDLRFGVVSRVTLTKYQRLFDEFSTFAISANYRMHSVYDLDVALCDYICELWQDGMPKGDTLRIAMAHTGVNLFMAASLLPFASHIAKFLTKIT